MNVKLIISALLLASWSSVLPAQPWIPTECQPRHDKAWSAFREAMRKAGPESPIYAPKPFPHSDAEVIEDFRYGFQRMWRGTPEVEIPPDQLRVYRGIVENRLRYRILRVNNWTPIRCLPKKQEDAYFLLYVLDKDTGAELSRFSLAQSGLVAAWTTTPTDTALRKVYLGLAAPELNEAVARVEKRFGIRGSRPQYVVTWGSVACALPAPCVALQSGGRAYLLQDGQELFEIGPQSRSHSRAEMNDPARRAALHANLTTEERLVSIGSERWVVARRVPPLP